MLSLAVSDAQMARRSITAFPIQWKQTQSVASCALGPQGTDFGKKFEPKLLEGDCATQGFTKYVKTETDGVWPLEATNDRYVRPGVETIIKRFCPSQLHAIYADMHDGDKKEIQIAGTSLLIRPHGNNQTWTVRAELDSEKCSASVNFNTPGKPHPPPVNLLATLWYSVSSEGKRTEIEFTDPSGTLGPKDLPLNRWVEVKDPSKGTTICPKLLRHTYADMHDGDRKEIHIDGTVLTIKPSSNNQTWVVSSILDTESCTATVNFKVPGKPSPPPVSLKATLIYSVGPTTKKTMFGFTDPSGTLAGASFPLNRWVETQAGMIVVI